LLRLLSPLIYFPIVTVQFCPQLVGIGKRVEASTPASLIDQPPSLDAQPRVAASPIMKPSAVS
jgi:hypothetical protein